MEPLFADNLTTPPTTTKKRNGTHEDAHQEFIQLTKGKGMKYYKKR